MEGLTLRKDFDKIYTKYAKIGKGNVRLTQSALTLIQDISGQKTVYTFPVLENDNATGIKPEEIRLNQNDSFITTSLGVYLMAKKLDGESNPVGGFVRLTYNPLEVATGADVAQALYDGFFRASVNNINYVDKWDISKHENVQRTEWNKQIAVGLNGSTRPSIKTGSDGMVTCAPMLTLEGSKKNELSIILPQAINQYTFAIVDQNGATETYKVLSIGLQLRGLLAQNASVFQGTGVK
jgi:hypothetical protein